MKTTLFISVLIKTFIGYFVFAIILFVFDFYLAQNILTLIGAIYISLAWLKYLVKDNLLKYRKIKEQKDKIEPKNDYFYGSITYVIAALLCFIIAIF